MRLTDPQINFFVDRVLKLPRGKRQAFLQQVDYLIGRMQAKIDEDSSFNVLGFTKTGSLVKGTVLRPRGDNGVDADVAVDLDVAEASKEDIASLHDIILNLLCAVYPQKKREDFKIQPHTLGIHFQESGLDVDLVPLIPIFSEPGFAWQPSSQGAPPVKTCVRGQLAFIRGRSQADPRYRILVRLIKGWRNAQDLDHLRSFAIELILAHLQDVQGPAQDLEKGLLRFFLYLAQTELKEPISFPENGDVAEYPDDIVIILDPVNKDNNVTVRMTDVERCELVKKAMDAWELINTAHRNGFKGETMDYWKDVFGRSFIIEE